MSAHKLVSRDERRAHPRLAIRLPVAYRPVGSPNGAFHHHYTTNVGPGGIQFTLLGTGPLVGDRLEVELSIPPGEGHFPYAGRIRGNGTVVRCQPSSRGLPNAANRVGGPQRWAIAARFDEPLALEFR